QREEYDSGQLQETERCGGRLRQQRKPEQVKRERRGYGEGFLPGDSSLQKVEERKEEATEDHRVEDEEHEVAGGVGVRTEHSHAFEKVPEEHSCGNSDKDQF